MIEEFIYLCIIRYVMEYNTPTIIKKATFRIVVKDLVKNESRTISLQNHHDLNVDDIKSMIISCLEKGTTKQQ